MKTRIVKFKNIGCYFVEVWDESKQKWVDAPVTNIQGYNNALTWFGAKWLARRNERNTNIEEWPRLTDGCGLQGKVLWMSKD